MSTGKRIPLAVAEELASRIVDALGPHVERIQVAGSIRRRRKMVGDIEIVVEPVQGADMFGQPGGPDVESIRRECDRFGKFVRGGYRMMKFTDIHGFQDVSLDLFMTHPPSQWGSILAIRTGPASFSEWCMKRLLRRGLRHVAGHVEHQETGELVPTPEEADFFRACGMDWVEPEERGA